ncbi:MAG: hypothetical protein J5830_02840 [Clostridia bacterium]|nr:hypothetical protein [Clostridia bacterium]
MKKIVAFLVLLIAMTTTLVSCMNTAAVGPLEDSTVTLNPSIDSNSARSETSDVAAESKDVPEEVEGKHIKDEYWSNISIYGKTASATKITKERLDSLDKESTITVFVAAQSANIPESVLKVHKEFLAQKTDLLCELTAEKAGITKEQAYDYLVTGSWKYRDTVIPDNKFDGMSQEEIDAYMAQRPPQDVLEARDAVVESAKYQNGIREIYSDGIKYLSWISASDLISVKNLYGKVSALFGEGVEVLADIKDERYAAALTYLQAVCVVRADAGTISGVFDKLKQNGFAVYFVSDEPLLTEVLG